MKIYENLHICDFTDLIKGAVTHLRGYFTHLHPKQKLGLVPEKRMRKDGTEQVYWVNPDPEKNKLRPVHFASDDDHASHMQHVLDTHGLKPEDIVHYSAGDKVKIVKHGTGTGVRRVDALIGKTGIVKRVHTDSATPQIKVAIKNSTTGKMEDHYVNVNNIALEARGTKETIEAVKPKMSKTKKKTEEPIESLTAYHNKQAQKIVASNVYTDNTTGERFFVKKVLHDGTTSITSLSGGPRDSIDTAVFNRGLQSGTISRQIPTSTVDKKEKPNSYKLESGEAWKDGTITFDGKGNPILDEDTKKFAGEVIAEYWDDIQNASVSAASRFSAIDKMTIEDIAANMFEHLQPSVVNYEPYVGNMAGGIRTRLIVHARKMARVYAHRTVMEKRDMVPIDTTAESILDEAPEYEPRQFIAPEAIPELQVQLDAENAWLATIYDKPEVAELISRWTGIGRFEPDIEDQNTIAEKLFGKVTNTRDGSILSLGYLKSWWVTNQKTIMRNKITLDPSLHAMLDYGLRFKTKLHAKRDYEPYTYSVDTVAARKYGDAGSESKRKLGMKLLEEGVPFERIPKAVSVLNGIFSSRIRPAKFVTEIPEDLVGPISRTVDKLGGLWQFYEDSHGNVAKRRINVMDAITNASEAARTRAKERTPAYPKPMTREEVAEHAKTWESRTGQKWKLETKKTKTEDVAKSATGDYYWRISHL